MAQPRWRWARIDDIVEGQTATLRTTVTEELIEATAQLTGDFNPLHVDPEAALAAGQSRPVAHGVILLGLISRLIGMELPGPGAVWFEHQVEFLAPVFAGDEVEVTARVTRVSRATNVIVLALEARKLGNVPVLRGSAKVRVPSVFSQEAADMADAVRVAVVTGASRGLGRAIAEGLAARGFRVVINYRGSEAAARDVQAAIVDHGGGAVAVAADVSTPDGARQLFDGAIDAYGRVDAIVHNATPPIVRRPYLETSAEEFRAFFDTYVIGLHELTRAAAPGMKERRFGRIVSVLSSYIAETPTKLAAYTTGKYALLGFCRALAVELGPANINVNMVSPSEIMGPQTDELGVAAREVMTRKIPLRRLAQPADVARTVAFLLSDDASFISGANVPVTGGLLL
jgi:3-oxoacyl-[acyl-carrier protein] reductase